MTKWCMYVTGPWGTFEIVKIITGHKETEKDKEEK